MDKQAIETRVREIIAKELEVGLETLEPGDRFDDNLGANSMSYLEMIIGLEDEYDIVIPEVDYPRIETVQEAIDYITERMLKKE